MTGTSNDMIKQDRIYRLIKEKILSRFSPDEKIPSESELALEYSVSRVTVRAALARLEQEKFIWRRRGKGTFAAERKENTSPNAELPGEFPSVGKSLASVRLLSGSFRNPGENFWKEAATGFHAVAPTAKLCVEYGYDPDPEKLPDVMEVASPLSLNAYRGTFQAMDLSGFFKNVMNDCHVRQTNGQIPFYHSTCYAFFNTEYLEKFHLPRPAYRDFSGQNEYLGVVTEALRESSPDATPGSTQQPNLHLGRHLLRISDMLQEAGRSGDTKAAADYCRECIRPAMELFLRYKTYADSPENPVEWFLRREVPFFFGTSSDYSNNAAGMRGFPLLCMPYFACDDSIIKIMVPLKVSASTEYPCESIQLLSHLQTAEVQTKIANLGFLPIGSGVMKTSEFMNRPGLNAFQQELEKAESLSFRNIEECYLCMNIVNLALWRYVTCQISLEQAVSNLCSMALSYLKMRAWKKSVR